LFFFGFVLVDTTAVKMFVVLLTGRPGREREAEREQKKREEIGFRKREKGKKEETWLRKEN